MKRNLITLELRYDEININSGARIVQLAKSKAITHFLTHATAFSGSHFSHAKQKLGNSNEPYCKTKNAVELKRCKTPRYYKYYNLIKLKPQKGKAIFNFGIWLRHMKTGNCQHMMITISEKYTENSLSFRQCKVFQVSNR